MRARRVDVRVGHRVTDISAPTTSGSRPATAASRPGLVLDRRPVDPENGGDRIRSRGGAPLRLRVTQPLPALVRSRPRGDAGVVRCWPASRWRRSCPAPGRASREHLFTHHVFRPAILQISSYWRQGLRSGSTGARSGPGFLRSASTRVRAPSQDLLARNPAAAWRSAGANRPAAGPLSNIPDRTLTRLRRASRTGRCSRRLGGMAQGGGHARGIDTRTCPPRPCGPRGPGLFAIGEALDVTGWSAATISMGLVERLVRRAGGLVDGWARELLGGTRFTSSPAPRESAPCGRRRYTAWARSPSYLKFSDLVALVLAVGISTPS